VRGLLDSYRLGALYLYPDGTNKPLCLIDTAHSLDLDRLRVDGKLSQIGLVVCSVPSPISLKEHQGPVFRCPSGEWNQGYYVEKPEKMTRSRFTSEHGTAPCSESHRGTRSHAVSEDEKPEGASWHNQRELVNRHQFLIDDKFRDPKMRNT